MIIVDFHARRRRSSSSAASTMHHHMHTHEAATTKHIQHVPRRGDHSDAEGDAQLVVHSGSHDTLWVDATTSAAATGARTTAFPQTAADRNPNSDIPDAPAAKPAQSKATLGHAASTKTQNHPCDCMRSTNQRCETAMAVDS